MLKNTFLHSILALIILVKICLAGDAIDLQKVIISGKPISEAIDTLKAWGIEYRIVIKKVSDRQSGEARVLTLQEGPHFPPNSLKEGGTLTVFVEVPFDTLVDRVIQGGEEEEKEVKLLIDEIKSNPSREARLIEKIRKDLSGVGRADTKLQEQIEEKDHKIGTLESKIKDLEGKLTEAKGGSPGSATVIWFSSISFLLLFAVIVYGILTFPNRMGNAFAEVSSGEKPAGSRMRELQRVHEAVVTHERKIAEISTSINRINKNIPNTEEFSARTNQELDNIKAQVYVETKDWLKEEVARLRKIGPDERELSLTEAYNRVMLSEDRDLQEQFISSRKATRATPEGELAEKGYMAQEGAEYLLKQHPGGKFLVIEEKGIYRVFPHFDLDLYSRYMSSAFTMPLTSLQGPKDWQVMCPAKAEKIKEGVWRLTERGEIGSEASIEDRIKNVESATNGTSQEIEKLRQEIKSAVVEATEQNAEELFQFLLKRLESNPEFLDFITTMLDERIRRSGNNRLRAKKQEQETQREEKKSDVVSESQEQASKIQVGEVKAEKLREESQIEAKESIAGKKMAEVKTEKPLLEVVFYNDRLKSDPITQKEFLQSRNAIFVRAERVRNRNIYIAQKAGVLFLTKNPSNTDEYLVFPAFTADPVTVSSTFNLSGKKPGSWYLRKPAICRKISEDQWELIEKGEIVFE